MHLLTDKAKVVAEILRDAILNTQVLLELVVILDDLVTPALQLMDEGARAFRLMRLTLSVGQEVCTVLTCAKRALQRVTVAHLKSVQTL